jgi:hypothetical protein
LENNAEMLLWVKYKFFEVGISPNEFRKCHIKDIQDIMEIKNAIDERAMREQEIRNMIASMK